MPRNLIPFLLILCFTLLSGCSSKKKSDAIKNYAYQEEKAILNPALQARMGDWLEEGRVCWGLVVLVNRNRIPQRGLPVKAKVITIQRDSIKMKALEAVNLSQVKGCTRMGPTKGETWWEKDGELFRTKEEAESFLKKKLLLE